MEKAAPRGKRFGKCRDQCGLLRRPLGAPLPEEIGSAVVRLHGADHIDRGGFGAQAAGFDVKKAGNRAVVGTVAGVRQECRKAFQSLHGEQFG